MRIFLGGQIEPAKRGNLAAIVKRPLSLNGGEKYSVFVYPIDSMEFIHLTGMDDAHEFTERIYLGITSAIGNDIASKLNRSMLNEANLRQVDEAVVLSHFINKYPEQQKRIILEHTLEGYKEIKLK